MRHAGENYEATKKGKTGTGSESAENTRTEKTFMI